MKNLLYSHTRQALTIAASLTLLIGMPLTSNAYENDFVKKVKVKDHKVKVKTVDGKAKIKNKANGDQKFKAKGPNGDLAADIAYEAAGYPPQGLPAGAVPYYK
jgi:hypothetical protein